MYIHNYSSGAAVKVNALSPQLQIQTDREGLRQWDGVSLQMCIPPASGGIKPLNIARQECKHTKQKDEAPGASQE